MDTGKKRPAKEKSFIEAENRFTEEKGRGTDLLVPYVRSNIEKCMCSRCPPTVSARRIKFRVQEQ